MKAAVVHDTERAPRDDEFPDPFVGPGRVEAEVLASAVHVIVRTITAGRHDSGQTAPAFVPGLDGVVRLPDGRRVYAADVQAPYGMLTDRGALPQGLTLADDLAAPLAPAAGPDGAYDVVLDHLWGPPVRLVLVP